MHIGQGYIGEAGFRNIINHPFLRNIPFILETPKENEEDDRKNISFIKKMKQYRGNYPDQNSLSMIIIV